VRGLSYGMQAGAQSFSEAMFLMTDSAITELSSGTGLSVGVGPSVVVVDEGMARSMTTTTMKSDVYAFIFGQEGLMAGLGVQGQRIVKFE
jgi:lipid-binding SYLF domain-containing protein